MKTKKKKEYCSYCDEDITNGKNTYQDGDDGPVRCTNCDNQLYYLASTLSIPIPNDDE